MLDKTFNLLLELVSLEVCSLHKTRKITSVLDNTDCPDDSLKEHQNDSKSDYYMFIVAPSKVYFILNKDIDTGKLYIWFKNVYTYLDLKLEVEDSFGVDSMLESLVRQSIIAYIPNLVLKLNKVDAELLSKIKDTVETTTSSSYMITCRKGY